MVRKVSSPLRIRQREVYQSDVKDIADHQIQGGEESTRALNLKDWSSTFASSPRRTGH
jgi:hypothetical protein